jgi:hypothetical protein
MRRNKATPPDRAPPKEAPEQAQTDTPLLDLSGAAIKKLIRNASVTRITWLPLR